MLIRIAVFLLEHSPLLRCLLWRWWYGRLASKHQSGDWTFMNYGFVEIRDGQADVSSLARVASAAAAGRASSRAITGRPRSLR